jgi:hypothetical protein
MLLPVAALYLVALRPFFVLYAPGLALRAFVP